MEDPTGFYFEGRLLALPANIHTRVEVIVGGKHASLVGFEVNYDLKKFYETGPRSRSYKTVLE